VRNKYLKLFLATCSLLLVTFFISEFATAENVLYYQCDAQGTPVAMTNAQGTVVWQGGCSPFGEDFPRAQARESRGWAIAASCMIISWGCMISARDTMTRQRGDLLALIR
jgi:hypothetical protein